MAKKLIVKIAASDSSASAKRAADYVMEEDEYLDDVIKRFVEGGGGADGATIKLYNGTYSGSSTVQRKNLEFDIPPHE